MMRPVLPVYILVALMNTSLTLESLVSHTAFAQASRSQPGNDYLQIDPTVPIGCLVKRTCRVTQAFEATTDQRNFIDLATLEQQGVHERDVLADSLHDLAPLLERGRLMAEMLLAEEEAKVTERLRQQSAEVRPPVGREPLTIDMPPTMRADIETYASSDELRRCAASRAAIERVRSDMNLSEREKVAPLSFLWLRDREVCLEPAKKN